jgi:hypothetical protein
MRLAGKGGARQGWMSSIPPGAGEVRNWAGGQGGRGTRGAAPLTITERAERISDGLALDRVFLAPRGGRAGIFLTDRVGGLAALFAEGARRGRIFLADRVGGDGLFFADCSGGGHVRAPVYWIAKDA